LQHLVLFFLQDDSNLDNEGSEMSGSGAINLSSRPSSAPIVSANHQSNSQIGAAGATAAGSNMDVESQEDQVSFPVFFLLFYLFPRTNGRRAVNCPRQYLK